MAKTFGAGGWTMSVGGISRTKKLLEEISVQFDSDVVYIVGPQVEYAVYHELGTSTMAARPFMRPAAARVLANMLQKVEAIASSQGIPLTSEENLVRAVALAVETEARTIADQKDIRDTGTLINSIEARRVR